jgi:hypothetical protein
MIRFGDISKDVILGLLAILVIQESVRSFIHQVIEKGHVVKLLESLESKTHWEHSNAGIILFVCLAGGSVRMETLLIEAGRGFERLEQYLRTKDFCEPPGGFNLHVSFPKSVASLVFALVFARSDSGLVERYGVAMIARYTNPEPLYNLIDGRSYNKEKLQPLVRENKRLLWALRRWALSSRPSQQWAHRVLLHIQDPFFLPCSSLSVWLASIFESKEERQPIENVARKEALSLPLLLEIS